MSSCYCTSHHVPEGHEENNSIMDSKPIGVFWDIENCSVPRGKSAQKLVQVIREKFFEGHTEVIFMCVCDVSKESKVVIEELNKAQVMIVHINAVSKNAADDKLRQCLRRFATDHAAPATVILISGDINFASELSDLRYRHHHNVILIHPPSVQHALLACCHQYFPFDQLCLEVPKRIMQPEILAQMPTELLVTGIKSGTPSGRIRQRLKLLSDNCGGKVTKIANGSALIAFNSLDIALRAQKRLDGETVFGSKIKVQLKNAPKAGIAASSKDESSAASRAADGVNSCDSACEPNLDDAIAATEADTTERISPLNDTANAHDDASVSTQRSETTQVQQSDEDTSKDLTGKKANTNKGQLSRFQIKTKPNQPSEAAKKKSRRSKSHKKGGAKSGNAVQVAAASATNMADKDSSVEQKTDPTAMKASPPCDAIKVKSIKPQSPANVIPSSAIPQSTPPVYKSEAIPQKQPGSYASQVLKKDVPGNSASDPRMKQQKELRDVVARFNKEHKTSRELVCIQQQLYNDDQETRQLDSCHERFFTGFSSQTPMTGYSREECQSAPPYPSWSSPKMPSPQHVRHFTRRSPNFRRTPGASRPSSRCSSTSSDCNQYGWSNQNCHTTPPSRGSPELPEPGFKPVPNRSNQQNAMLTASLLVSGSSESLNDAEYDGDSVEVMVSNLDYNISGREWRKILYAEFYQHVRILKVYIQTQPDNTNVAYIRVPTIDDARILICQFHRKKIGYKRIHISLANDENGNGVTSSRSEVVALLKEVTGHKLPLFKFIELFEKRFHQSISVSELFRMKDTVEVTDGEGTGRVVQLLAEVTSSQTSSRATSPEQASKDDEGIEWPVCRTHCEEGSAFYVDALDSSHLPWVILQVKSFAPQVHTLLQTHNGSMPLMSFPACYAAEFGSLSTVTQGGVPLEHLITCVPGAKVIISASGTKKVQWAENKPPPTAEFNRRGSSPVLGQQLVQFSREIVDLLKHSPHCRLPFSKFIPSYHHHFGRQCRVADYGFTRLMELFDALSHVVQVIGVGSRRFVTLTHRAQVKRFTCDLLRILKTRSNKQIGILEFPTQYNKIVGKQFHITEFGVCYIEDLLCEVDSCSVAVSGSGNEISISVAQRDQTQDETERTKQFAVELVDLLKHSPQCRMPFPKFIPSYHHHFGRQCRVADYGFTRLLELFEAVPNVVKIVDEQDERVLCLTEPELLKVLEEQIGTLLNTMANKELPVPELLAAYMRQFGHSLRLPDYGVSSVVDLIKKIPKVAQVESYNGRLVIVLVDHSRVQQLTQHLLKVFLKHASPSLSLPTFHEAYEEQFSQKLDETVLEQDLEGIVEVKGSGAEASVKLCPLQQFARDVITILQQHQGVLPLHQFEATFASHFGVALVPASYGYPNVVSLLMAIPHALSMQGKGFHRVLVLSSEFQAADQAAYENEGAGGQEEACEEQELMWLPTRSHSPYDLLHGPIPSAVPSPDLRPVSCTQQDLMNFHQTQSDVFKSLDEAEKSGLKTPLCRTPVSDMLHFAAQLLPLDLPTAPSSSHHRSSLQEERPQTSVQCAAVSSMIYPPMPVSAPHVDVVQQQLQAQAAQALTAHADVPINDTPSLTNNIPTDQYYNHTYANACKFTDCYTPRGSISEIPPPPSCEWLESSLRNIHLPQSSCLQNNISKTPSSYEQNLDEPQDKSNIKPSTPPGLQSKTNDIKNISSAVSNPPKPLTPQMKSPSAHQESPVKTCAGSPGSNSSQGTPRRSRIAAKFWNPIEVSPGLDVGH